ncbi:Mn2+/Fe2+ NRAMP family transporter [Clostridium pascui]|nr:Mn2+/Fe2+ NRAMP family transporter [Clostridium pascui]
MNYILKRDLVIVVCIFIYSIYNCFHTKRKVEGFVFIILSFLSLIFILQEMLRI